MFSDDDIVKIAGCLAPEQQGTEGDHYRMKLVNADERRMLVLELYPKTRLGRELGSMVVVYTAAGHLQLHNCTGYVVSEELGEVTFVAETDGHMSGLVVEREAACSIYAHVKRELISGDLTQLGVEVMLSGVALSLAEESLGRSEKD